MEVARRPRQMDLRRYLERRLGPRLAGAKRGFPSRRPGCAGLKRLAEQLLSPDAIRASGHFNVDEVQRRREHWRAAEQLKL